MGPRRLLLLRHAEDAADGGVGLSTRGEQRAEALVAWVPGRFGTPDVIVAAKSSDHSHRPVRTVKPLAQRLGLSVIDEFDDGDWPALTKALFTQPRFQDAFVVVCWRHQALPALAAALGMAGVPSPWPEDEFDSVHLAEFAVTTQRVTQPR